MIQHFLVFVSPAKKDKVDLELREKTERIQKGRKRHQKVKHESLVTLTAQNLTQTLDASCVRFAVSADLFFFTPCQREKGLSGKDCLQRRRCGFNPWVGRSPGEGKGSPLQYARLGNPVDRGAWQTTAHGVTKELYVTE